MEEVRVQEVETKKEEKIVLSQETEKRHGRRRRERR